MDVVGQIAQQAAQWGLEEWKTEPSKLSKQEISAIVPVASKEQKIEALVNGLSDLTLLETTGSELTLIQLLFLIDAVLEGRIQLKEKLNPILVGMQQPVFRALLSSCSDRQLTALQQESMSEAVQHHLTLLVHELNAEVKAWTTSLALLRQEIDELPIEELEASELAKVPFMIDSLQTAGEQLLYLLSRALALSWKASRSDLIDQFSQLKEQCQRSLAAYFKTDLSLEKDAFSLRAALDAKLDSVFTTSGKEGSSELNEDEPALEALVCFALWYPKDYWEVGLLPQFKTLDQLELDPEKYSEQERMAHREKLFQMTAQQLSRLGLHTLRDLKQARLYSKKALCRYIQENADKLL